MILEVLTGLLIGGCIVGTSYVAYRNHNRLNDLEDMFELDDATVDDISQKIADHLNEMYEDDNNE